MIARTSSTGTSAACASSATVAYAVSPSEEIEPGAANGSATEATCGWVLTLASIVVIRVRVAGWPKPASSRSTIWIESVEPSGSCSRNVSTTRCESVPGKELSLR
jgi:hypothetical protein